MRTLADFAETTNLQVLLAAGIKPTTPEGDESEFLVACPECGEDATLDGDKVRCRNRPICGFGAARIVDLLAAKAGSYPKVYGFLTDAAPEFTKSAAWKDLPSFLVQAHLRRWLRSFARSGTPRANNETATLLSAARKRGLDRLESRGAFLAIDKKTLATLKAASLDAPPLPCLALPLWNAEAEFCGLAFLTSPMRFLRFGDDPVLTAWQPSRIGDLDVARALEQAEKVARTGGTQLPPAFAFGGGGRSQMSFNLRAPTQAEYVSFGTLQRRLPNLKVENIPAEDWVVKHVCSSCDPHLGMAARRLLESCPPSTAVQYRIEEILVAEKKLEAARALRAMAHSRELFRVTGGAVKVTPGGYTLAGTSDETRLTNFALVLHDNLVFDDLSDIWHSGTVELAGNRWLVTIGASDLAKPDKLESALRGQAPAGGALPTVLEPSKVAKLLMPWWRKQIAELPQQVGVSSLGWSADRKRFQGAGWYVSMDAVTQSDILFRPDIPALRVFDHHAATADHQLTDEMPPAARDLIAMLAATLCRLYVRSKVAAVTIQNSNHARQLCNSLFRALGQRSAFEMSSNLRNHTHIPGISGHPLLAVGYNPLQAASCRLPCFFLTEQGYTVVAGDYRPVTLTARWILQRVVSWILATDGAEFAEQRAFHYQVSLVKEGTAAIAAACQIAPWETCPPSLPYLEALVSPRTAQSIGEIMRLNQDDVLINTTAAGDLLAELLGAGIHATREENVVAAPVLQLSPLLTDYFGQAPCFS